MRSVRFAVATLVIAAAAFAVSVSGALAGATGGKVLICGTNATWSADVQARLIATGRFAEVNVFDCAAGTPTDAQLAGYAGVLVIYSTQPLAEPKKLGDELADFADGGGRVVEAMFEFNPGQTLKGRWRTDNYSAFQLASGVAVYGGDMPYVEDVPSSPLLVGVGTFTGGTTRYHLHVSVAGDATLIAHWADDQSTPLEAAGPHSVALNFDPTTGEDNDNDFWNSSTDGTTLIANALAPPALAAQTSTPGFAHIAVCTRNPVLRVADNSWGTFADIDVALWQSGKTDASSPFWGASPAIYVAGYGLMCQLSDVASYGGDPGAFAPAGYTVDENGNAAPAGTDPLDAAAYYAYYTHS
jgi:hypothetical protein